MAKQLPRLLTDFEKLQVEEWCRKGLSLASADRALDPVYRLTLVFTERLRVRWGAGYYRPLCPITGKPASKLYLPPSGDRFASSAGLNLRTPSNSYSSRHRPLRTLQRLQREVEATMAAHQPKSYRGGCGLGRATLIRLRTELDEADRRVVQGAMARYGRGAADGDVNK